VLGNRGLAHALLCGTPIRDPQFESAHLLAKILKQAFGALIADPLPQILVGENVPDAGNET